MLPPTPPSSPQALIAWALERFSARELVITTGFGMEGCAMIDMIDRCPAAADGFTVSYLDTHFLFAETHDLRERLQRRYPRLDLVNRGTSLTPAAQKAAHGPELWRTNPDLCCQLRKVEPMRELLRGADAWMTAVRREQSDTRAATEHVSWDAQFELVKISPLAAWRRDEVWQYVREHDVPYNALHDQGYPSIGCTHCTSPVLGSRPADYSRAGRWEGREKTECGLHVNHPNPSVTIGPRPRVADS